MRYELLLSRLTIVERQLLFLMKIWGDKGDKMRSARTPLGARAIMKKYLKSYLYLR